MSILRVAYGSEEPIAVLVETTGDPTGVACQVALVKSHIDISASGDDIPTWADGYWESDEDGWWATVDFPDLGDVARGWWLVYLTWTVNESTQPRKCAGSLEVY